MARLYTRQRIASEHLLGPALDSGLTHTTRPYKNENNVHRHAGNVIAHPYTPVLRG